MTVGEDITNVRNKEYADAWAKTGVLLAPIKEELFRFLMMAPRHFFPWLLIFNKLLRALATPYNRDHWLDIIGYATLVLHDVDTNKGKG